MVCDDDDDDDDDSDDDCNDCSDANDDGAGMRTVLVGYQLIAALMVCSTALDGACRALNIVYHQHYV